MKMPQCHVDECLQSCGLIWDKKKYTCGFHLLAELSTLRERVKKLDAERNAVLGSMWRDRAENAEEALAELKAESQWVSVEDRLPENEDMVLTAGHSGHYDTPWEQEIARYVSGRYWTNNRIIVTHWRPRIAPPTTEGSKEN